MTDEKWSDEKPDIGQMFRMNDAQLRAWRNVVWAWAVNHGMPATATAMDQLETIVREFDKYRAGVIDQLQDLVTEAKNLNVNPVLIVREPK